MNQYTPYKLMERHRARAVLAAIEAERTKL